MSEIFDQLFKKLGEESDSTHTKVEKLKLELSKQSGLVAEAKEALAIATRARAEAEVKLEAAVKERVSDESKLKTLLDDLGSLASDPIKKKLKEVSEGLGIPALENSFAELEERVAEVGALSVRAKSLGVMIFTGPNWWTHSLLVVAAIAVPAGIAVLSIEGNEWMKQALSGATRSILQVTTGIAAIAGWLSARAKTGAGLVKKLEDSYKEVKAVRSERESGAPAAKIQRDLVRKREAERDATSCLRDAEKKVNEIRAEIAELAPGRQLIRFLKERASAEDYRRHLGLVSLVRRDFEKLSDLLLQAHEAGDSDLPRVDRIVLYIDDLDRCRADRVIEVLEAVHLLLAFPLFAVVVAVDPRWLRQSLLDRYPRLLRGSDDQKGCRKPSTYAASPQDYLEKIFQVPFQINAMDPAGYTALTERLFPKPKVDENGQNESNRKAVDADTSGVESRENDGAKIEVKVPPALIVTPPPSSDPTRLILSAQEVEDVARFQPLFTTPRALKRFANTYALIRVGVLADEWDSYVGEKSLPGTYRIPMLMLAVTSAFPTLSSSWLQWLQSSPVSSWELSNQDVSALSARFADRTQTSDWRRLADAIGLVALGGWPKPIMPEMKNWAPRVARYSF